MAPKTIIVYAFITLVSLTFAGPANSCSSQANCLDVTVTETGTDEYKVCVENTGCSAISHCCIEGVSGETSDCDSGTPSDEAKKCKTLTCDGSREVEFGFKDGNTCIEGGGPFTLAGDSVSATCRGADSGDSVCDGGSQSECIWTINIDEYCFIDGLCEQQSSNSKDCVCRANCAGGGCNANSAGGNGCLGPPVCCCEPKNQDKCTTPPEAQINDELMDNNNYKHKYEEKPAHKSYAHAFAVKDGIIIGGVILFVALIGLIGCGVWLSRKKAGVKYNKIQQNTNETNETNEINEANEKGDENTGDGAENNELNENVAVNTHAQ